MGGSPSKDTQQMASREWSGAGQVAIVTGPMGTGIGFHTARWLAERGTHVILAGRSAERLQGCVEQLRAACKAADGSALPADQVQLTPLVLDLSSLQSVEEFAANFQALNLPLKLLINNAGIMATPYQQTKDGFEIQFGTNHLGHFCQLPSRSQRTAAAACESAVATHWWHQFAARLTAMCLVQFLSFSSLLIFLCRSDQVADAAAAGRCALAHRQCRIDG